MESSRKPVPVTQAKLIEFETPEGREKIFADVLSKNYTLSLEDPIPVEKLVEEGKLAEAIEHLHIEKDLTNGIMSKYVNPKSCPHQKVLIRDATVQVLHQETYQETYHSWAIMGLNYFNAAKKLLLTHGKKFNETQLKNFHLKAAG